MFCALVDDLAYVSWSFLFLNYIFQNTLGYLFEVFKMEI